MTGADFTRAEIDQQPELWRRLAEQMRTSDGASAEVSDWLTGLLSDPSLRIVLTGAGTSAFAGDLLAPELRRRLHRRVDAVSTTDIVSAPGLHFAEPLPTLLVSFGRSGDSPESVAATELADASLPRCHHLVVTCNPDGELARRHADRDDSRVLVMPAGSNDRGFAMTSSFTCMVLAVWLYLGAMAPSRVPALSAAAERVLAEHRSAATAVGQTLAAGPGRIVYLGSGALVGLARESALKILELTAGRVVALSDTALGFRHGPKSILDPHTTVVVYRSTDPYTARYDDDIAGELRRSRAERVITIGIHDDADWRLPLTVTTARGTETRTVNPQDDANGADDVDDVQAALLGVVCAQLIGLESALAVGTTPDNPFPSGTVNRVVQGVTIHPFDAQDVDGTANGKANGSGTPGEDGRVRHSHRAVL